MHIHLELKLSAMQIFLMRPESKKESHNGPDYRKLGFKCGLEIHRQLDTKTKLFCPCKARLSQEKPIKTIIRRLRSAAGELGEIDIAAAHETLQAKEFHYQVYPLETCEVELDEEPPHPLNPEALKIALLIAKMLNCEIPDEIQVMRKTVLDGSNTSGFQRTAIVGLNGWIETSKGEVGISNVAVEEEACQIIEKSKDRVVYGLDRLGIPLVEIGTDSSIKDPEHAMEVAEKLGMMLKSTGKVKAGIGTIRQDVNVSIKGGARVEIKGFQELRQIPKVIENEVLRQRSLVDTRKKVTKDVRRAMPDNMTEFMRPLPGQARMYPETDQPPIEVDMELLESLKVPKLITEKLADFEKKHGLNADLARLALELEQFEGLVKQFPRLHPKEIIQVMVLIPKDLRSREGLDTGRIPAKAYPEILKHLNDGNLNKDSVPEVLKQLSRSPGETVSGLVKQFQKGGIGGDELRDAIVKIIESKKEILQMHNPENVYMGLVMKELRGKAPGSAVMRILSEEVKKRK